MKDVTFHLVEDAWGTFIGPPLQEIDFSDVDLRRNPLEGGEFDFSNPPGSLSTLLDKLDVQDLQNLRERMAERGLRPLLDEDQAPIIRIQNSTTSPIFVTSPAVELQGLIACHLITALDEDGKIDPEINAAGDRLGFVVPGKDGRHNVREIRIQLLVKPPRIVEHSIECYVVDRDENGRLLSIRRARSGSDPRVTAKP
jgi:hypothetical protein